MQDGAAQIAAWSGFYVITGSAAAALTGLMFVVITLIAGLQRRAHISSEGNAAYSSPTVAHFCAALLISSIMAAPWHSLGAVAAMLAVAGFGGIGYMVRVVFRAQHMSAYRPLFEDWIWYGVLPFIAYASIAASAVLLLKSPSQVLYATAGSTLLLIFVGVHNAWDIVTYVAIDAYADADRAQEAKEDEIAPPAAR
jgi:hypothetical protein